MVLQFSANTKSFKALVVWTHPKIFGAPKYFYNCCS